MDYSLPGSSVHGIFQAKVPEWVAIAFSQGSSWPRDQTQGSNPGLPPCRQTLYHLSHPGSLLWGVLYWGDMMWIQAQRKSGYHWWSLKNLGTDPMSFLYLIFDSFLNITCPVILKEIISVLYLTQWKSFWFHVTFITLSVMSEGQLHFIVIQVIEANRVTIQNGLN